MKKHFNNILIKTGNKNRLYLLICSIILTISMGALTGCSIVKEKSEDTSDQSENKNYQFDQMAGMWSIDFEVTDPSLWGTGISTGNGMELSATGDFSYYIGIGVGGTGQCEEKDGRITVEIQPYEEHSSEKEILTLNYENDNEEEHILMNWNGENVYWKREDTSSSDSFSENSPSEKTIILSFSKEGETEQKQAVLTEGDGYSIYLPDGEWQQSDSNTWTAVLNEDVRLWTAHFQNKPIAQVEEELSENGYGWIKNEMIKQEGELVHKVRLSEFEKDVWGVFYCYPAEAEEGWGRELPVIADTFAISFSQDNGKIKSSIPEDSGTVSGASDHQEITNIVEEFAAAYFKGDVDTIQTFLVNEYEWNISTYEGTGTISDFTIKGLSDTDAENLENGQYIVSLEYRDSDYEDTFQYLTFTFTKQEDDWKILYYGLEN